MADPTARPEGRAAHRGLAGSALLTGAFMLAVAIALAGCGQRVDEAQAQLCRMTLPALNPAGADIRITRLAAARDGPGIRIDYTMALTASAASSSRIGPRRAFAVCRFDPVPFSPIEPRLAAIETQDGPVSGASVYLMQRFWLRSPEALAADPGR